MSSRALKLLKLAKEKTYTGAHGQNVILDKKNNVSEKGNNIIQF